MSDGILYWCWQDKQGRHRHNISVGMTFDRTLAPDQPIPEVAVSPFRNTPHFKCCKGQKA